MKKEAVRTLQVAGPLILGNLTQIALGLIDSAMVGAISYKQLAASSLVTNMLGIPYVLGIGITVSISPLVAIHNGRGDQRKVAHYAYNGFWLCALTGVLIALCVVLGRKIVYSMGQDPEVAALAEPYLAIMGWSIIPMMMFLALKQFTDGLEYTRLAMALSLFSLPLDTFLNWVFIFGKLGMPRLELVGAGLTTLFSRAVIFVVLLWVILKKKRFSVYGKWRRSEWVLKLHSWWELLKIGVPSSLQYGMEAGAFSVSGIMIGWLGATQQAAHQIALNCASATFMVSVGLSQAGSIRVSGSYGRNDFSGLRRIGFSTLYTALIYGVACGIFFILFRNLLPHAFNSNAEVVDTAAFLLLFAALFQISDSTQSIGVGLLRGVRDVKVPTLLVTIAYWVLGIPTGYYLAFKAGMGATGIWIGFVIGLSFSSVLLNFRFNKISRKLLGGLQIPALK